jgi:hypothetical protein
MRKPSVNCVLMTMPILLVGTQAPSSCTVEPDSGPRAGAIRDVPTTPGPLTTPTPPAVVDLATYSVRDLEAYRNYCDQQVNQALQVSDIQKAQYWTKIREQVASEIQRKSQSESTPERHRYWRGTGRNRKWRHKPVKEEPVAPEPTQPRDETTDQYQLPPGWPVGPKD